MSDEKPGDVPVRMCPKVSSYGHRPHGPMLPLHTCPYAEEINDDHETLCDCCEECMRECADDI